MQEDTLYGVLSIAGEPVALEGVKSWNTRTGHVMPEMNDYTYEQVGAFPATELLSNSDILNIWQDA